MGKWSEEARENFRQYRLRTKGSFLGKHHSEETKNKISLARKGQRNRWKGGRIISEGYVFIIVPGKGNRNSNSGHVAEHRHIAELAIGRLLLPTEIVHHANGMKDDNRPCNLVICQNDSYHQLLHKRMKSFTRDSEGRFISKGTGGYAAPYSSRKR
jgi:hypothetical protein